LWLHFGGTVLEIMLLHVDATKARLGKGTRRDAAIVRRCSRDAPGLG
jgi:hypothetical protein